LDYQRKDAEKKNATEKKSNVFTVRLQKPEVVGSFLGYKKKEAEKKNATEKKSNVSTARLQKPERWWGVFWVTKKRR